MFAVTCAGELEFIYRYTWEHGMALLWLTISWVSMSMCMTTPESIQTLNMAKQVDITAENRENRLCFLTCRGTP